MEKRYHDSVGFNHADYTDLKLVCSRFNDSAEITRSKHSMERMSEYKVDMMELARFFQNIVWDYKNIFEYYTENGKVKRMGFRIHFNTVEDMIIFIDRKKNIVTMWVNNKTNKKEPRDKSVYTTV